MSLKTLCILSIGCLYGHFAHSEVATSPDAKQEPDPFFAPWQPDEARKELGIKLSTLIDCPKHERTDLPLACQSAGMRIGIRDYGERYEDTWKDRLFTTSVFSWRLGGSDGLLPVYEMSWGDDLAGYVNCRSWPSFDALIGGPTIEASCVIAGGEVSPNLRIIVMNFTEEFFWTDPVEADWVRFRELVSSIARDML